MSVPPFLTYWGKAQADIGTPYPATHPAAYHCLDVAACVGAVLDARPRALARAGALLGVDDAAAVRRLLVSLAALHDLGKFAPTFQAKASEHWPARLGTFDPARIAPGRHTDDGYALWQGPLARVVTERLWPGAKPALGVLAIAVFGHHGSPVGAGTLRLAEHRFGPVALADALACADALLALLSPAPVAAAPVDPDAARLASWWVAGLMTVADWVGSGQRRFRYTAPRADDPSLAGYWAHTQAVAADAVRAAGLAAPPPASRRAFGELFGVDWPPTPAQAWAESAALPDGPALFVLEDVTGAGKTEAAHVLVHRLMDAGRAAGAFWAMPTQATANAMYARQAAVFERLYADAADPRPSLVLAHGQQRLHAEFRATVFRDEVLAGAVGDALGASPAGADRNGDGPSTAACAAFLADDRRAALLADVGAGTVDQALLGVLNSRYNALRLFALVDRVLVVDEAHAYDAYVSVEVGALLRFQAALGGSAVVLSATLPRKQRETLVRAWADGLRLAGQPAPDANAGALATSAAYPLATVVGGARVREEAVAAAPWSHRTVAVRLVHDIEAARAHVVAAARAGAAAAWVRNTVDDCLAAAAMVRAAGLTPLVFHARFAQADRQAREREVMARFGRDADPARRRGCVLVATQVVEQSLDLDFDAMVSDVAPADLLVQRAGRLWRHERPKEARPAGCAQELVVLSPVPNDDPPPDWLGGPFTGTAHVYPHAGVLWRTVRTLAARPKIVTPDGLRALIEAVYGDDEVPDGLLKAAQRAEGQQLGDAAAATYAALKVGDGYDASQSAWLSELRVPTRLGDEQMAVRLARVDGGRLVPWVDAEPPWKAWALSEVRVRRTRVPPDVAVRPEYAAAADAVRATWGRFEQELPVLPLEEQAPGLWRGELLRPDRGAVTLWYTREQGVSFVDPAQAPNA